MAEVAAALHEHPSRQLTVVGVTGTNGKTTTTHLLRAVFDAAGRSAGVIGSLGSGRTTPEAPELRTSIAQHCRLFGHAPDLVTADRGLDDPANEDAALAAGVKRVAIPRKGSVTPERQRVERQRWFRRAQRYRAGMEGRISVCKRRGRLGRCRDRGKPGYDRWIGWGILTENLTTIAQAAAARARTNPA